MNADWELACPICKNKLDIDDDQARCRRDEQTYWRVDGIWRLLRPDREAHFAQFVREYETVRRREGRSSDDPAYYRRLPYVDLSGQMSHDWAIRAQSFATLLQKVMAPLENERSSTTIPQPLKVVDLGAGNGWLAYQLTRRGHNVMAIDLTTNTFDGLGTHTLYDARFLPVQAEFDHLPGVKAQADLVIFNAAFHYATDYAITLREAWRILKPDGGAVIMDSPIYHDKSSGAQMVREREAHFQQTFGFPANAIASENYLTYQRLDQLSKQLDVRWRLHWPVPRWRRIIRRSRARLNRQREPAQFPLILGKRV